MRGLREKPASTMSRSPTIASRGDGGGDLAIVLTGGGARAAYQVGFLRVLARRMPDLRFDIVTGVSAGAINAAMLASHPGTLAEAAEELTGLWTRLRSEEVFRVDSPSLSRHLLTWGVRLASGGGRLGKRSRGFVDTQPLRRLLQRHLAPLGPGGEITGIRRNLDRGRLSACAIITLNYATGETVTWIQGRDVEGWEGRNRRAIDARITVEHVMASTSLPLFFPAVRLGRDWHGDGGIRLASPFAPSINLGAGRILAVSTRHLPAPDERDRPQILGYPPPAQILGHLMDAVFLDVLDEDAGRLAQTNEILSRLPPGERQGMRPVDLLVLRPSVDLGALAAAYEPRLPGFFRYFTRGLGTRETANPNLLSMLMFQPDYLSRCIEAGEADAEAHLGDIVRLVTGEPAGAGLRGSGAA